MCEGHHSLDCTLSVLCHFLLLSLSSHASLPKWRICWMGPIKVHNIAMVGILCDDTMSGRPKIRTVEKISGNLILAGWHLYNRDIILASPLPPAPLSPPPPPPFYTALKNVLRNFANQWRCLLFSKVAEKRGSDKGVFLRILWNF